MNEMDIVAGVEWMREFNFTNPQQGNAVVGGPNWGAEFVLSDVGNGDNVFATLSIANGHADWASVGRLWVKMTADETAQLGFLKARWKLYLIGPDKCKNAVMEGVLERSGTSCAPCQHEEPQLIRLKQGSYFGFSGSLRDKDAVTPDFKNWKVRWQIRSCAMNTLVFDSNEVSVTDSGLFVIGAPTNQWPIGMHKTDLVIFDSDGHPAHTQTFYVEITEAVTML